MKTILEFLTIYGEMYKDKMKKKTAKSDVPGKSPPEEEKKEGIEESKF